LDMSASPKNQRGESCQRENAHDPLILFQAGPVL
jgi:hypothetical protein